MRSFGDRKDAERRDLRGDSFLIGQNNDLAAAGFDFLQIAQRLFEITVTRQQHNYRHLLIDERNGTMFHFAGGVALGMNVRNFFQLESPFESDGIVNSSAQVKKISIVR